MVLDVQLALCEVMEFLARLRQGRRQEEEGARDARLMDGAAIRLPDFDPEDGCLVGAGVEERRRGASLDVVFLFILKSTRLPALGGDGFNDDTAVAGGAR